jgi:hypothetical protein
MHRIEKPSKCHWGVTLGARREETSRDRYAVVFMGAVRFVVVVVSCGVLDKCFGSRYPE